jgi:hypothetical protein
MSGIKVTPADIAFGNCIKERSDWTCEFPGCNRRYPPPSSLQCCHYFSRGDWSTRFDKENCISMCFAHHSWMDGHHHQFREFMEKRLGSEKYAALVIRNGDSVSGEKFKQTKGVGEIAKFFREQYRQMVQFRLFHSEKVIDFEEYVP